MIDETNQATGKRVFPRTFGCCRDGFPSCDERDPDPDPDSSSIPTSKRLRAHRQATRCTARGAQNEGIGEPQIAALRRILSQRRVPQMIITQRKGATWADVHGAAPAARLGDAVSLPFRISTGLKHKHNRIPPGRLCGHHVLHSLSLLQEPTSFVPRWCDGLIAGGVGGLS